MDYLQYKENKANLQNIKLNEVLNLIINGLPSIHKRTKLFL